MIPRRRLRVLIIATIALGVLGWLLVRGPLTPVDGSPGFSLMSARAGWPVAAALVLLAGLPALALGLVASTMGNTLAGFFAVSAALTVLACLGGGIEGWMHRLGQPGSPTHLGLIAEVLLWFLGWVAMVLVLQRLRPLLRQRWPALAFTDHLGVDASQGLPPVQSLLGGGMNAAIGGILAALLLRSPDIGQVVGSLVLAFTISSVVTHLAFPRLHVLAILLGPAAVAIAGYAYVALTLGDQPQAVLAAWHQGRLLGLAQALPIYYASAGVAGCALGMGWAQVVAAGNQEVERGVPGDQPGQ